MTIPRGRAASRAWRSLPAEIRERAIALGRAGQPYPDPAIQRVIVGQLAHSSTSQHVLVLMMALYVTAPLSISHLDLTALLVVLPALVVTFIVLVVASLRRGRLRYLGPANVHAVAVITSAPAEPVILRRSVSSLLSGAAMICISALSMLQLAWSLAQDAAAFAHPVEGLVYTVGAAVCCLVVLATALVVVGYFSLGVGPAGRHRELGVVDADGVRLHHLRLAVPWQDIRKVNGTGEDGVTGLAIWLVDPARTLATSGLSPWRARSSCGARRPGGSGCPPRPSSPARATRPWSAPSRCTGPT